MRSVFKNKIHVMSGACLGMRWKDVLKRLNTLSFSILSGGLGGENPLGEANDSSFSTRHLFQKSYIGSMEDSQRNHSLRNTSEGSQKVGNPSSRNQFLRRILARSCSEDGSCPQTRRGEGRGAQECRSVGGSPRLARCDSHFYRCLTGIQTVPIQERVKAI